MGRLGHTPARRIAARHRAGRARRLGLAGSAVLAVLATMLFPAIAAAHPLGNFTINHYAAIRVGSDRVLVDLVIDQAEIPTFQERLDLDLDGDATVSPEEIDAGRRTECGALVPKLSLTAGGTAVPLTLRSAGLSFPPGAGGLSTMRVVCELEAPLPTPLTADQATTITFQDGSFPERIGWREIVADGSGAAVTATSGPLRGSSVSDRLRSYPADLLTTPLDDRTLALEATAASGALVPFVSTDATPLDPSADGGTASAVSPSPLMTAADPAPAAEPAAAVAGAVPGGVSGGDLPSIFRTADLTPFVVLLSFLTAVALGAGHALTPGHGKTLMAAYLVGTRGTATHALGLGLSVSLSHTVGILLLAAVIVGAADVLPPDLVVRAAPVVAAISIAFIGGWMLFGEWRRRRAVRAGAGMPWLAQDHHHDHDHDHDDMPGHAHPRAAVATTTPVIRARLEPAHATLPAGAATVDEDHVHSHGGVRHSHLPPIGGSISWRSLFVLGLAGGLIPSTSALLILLGSIAAGRPAFGFVLVVAFGLGMAAVMTGIGLAMVVARGRLERAPAGPTLRRVRDAVPLVAAVLVFGFAFYLTAQAVAGAPTL